MNKSVVQFSLFLTLMVVASMPVTAAGSEKFGGKWLSKSKSGSFEIDLIQTGERIRGAHFSAVDNGRRIDNQENPDETGPSIVGKVQGNNAAVDITSSYSGTSGKATMTLEKGKLRWLLNQKPAGEYYFPDSAILSKQKGPVMEIAEHPSAQVQAMSLSSKARENESAGRLDESLSLIDRAIKLDPSDWTSYDTRGDVLMKLKKYDTAIGAFTKAVEMCPADMQCMIKPNRGQCYVMSKKADLAIKDLTEAIERLKTKVSDNDSLKPYLSRSYHSRAEAYNMLGKSDLASSDEVEAKKYSK